MTFKPIQWAGPLAVSIFLGTSANAAEWRWQLGAEARYFTQAAINQAQHGTNVSAYFQGELFNDFDEGRQRVVATPFLRLDQGDSERTHADLRELFWRYRFSAADLYVGMRTVFWGVTEALHLVDIINQTDLVENPDSEDKLGQPMVQLSFIRDWGTWDVFFLPVFRERTFPGPEGRLRPPLLPGISEPVYESARGKRHSDWALRYSHALGAFEFGLAHFTGTGREPLFVSPGGTAFGAAGLLPFYEQIDQTSLDLAVVAGGWLWKLEAFSRRGQLGRFEALTAGFEYTLVGLGASALDLGLIAEYQYDERGNPLATFQNDLALGGRLAFNDVQDTQVLLLGTLDREGGGGVLSLEASRRLGNNGRLSLEGRWFRNSDPTDVLYFFRQDDYLQLAFTHFF